MPKLERIGSIVCGAGIIVVLGLYYVLVPQSAGDDVQHHSQQVAIVDPLSMNAAPAADEKMHASHSCRGCALHPAADVVADDAQSDDGLAQADAARLLTDDLISVEEERLLDEFDRWLKESSDDPEQQERGMQLATARNPVMRRLITEAPAEAYARGLPEATWRGLPARMQAVVERLVQGTGIYSAGFTCGDQARYHDLHMGDVSTSQVSVTDTVGALNGVFGAQVTGVSLQELAAVVELKDPVDITSESFAMADGDISTDGSAFSGHPRTYYDVPTLGAIKVLVLIVRYNDEANFPISISTAQSIMNDVAAGYNQFSYGQLTMTYDVAEVVIPGNIGISTDDMMWQAMDAAELQNFNENDYDVIVRRNSQIGNVGWFNTKATAIKNSNWTTWLHEIGHCMDIAHSNWWKPDSNMPAWSENGLNMLYAEYFDAMANSPRGDFNAYEKVQLEWLAGAEVAEDVLPGVYRIYPYDSHAGGFDGTDVNGAHYVVSVFKDTAANSGGVSDREYVLSVRNQPEKTGSDNNPWYSEGVCLHWKPWTLDGSDGYNANGVYGTSLVDVHPRSDNSSRLGEYKSGSDAKDQYDAPILIGETYIDDDPDNRDGNIYITPLVKVDPDGTPRSGDEYVDVKIVKGDQANNAAPTADWTISKTTVAPGEAVSFLVTASDADDTVFGYLWDFGLGVTGLARRLMPLNGLPDQSFSWSTEGVYTVSVVVSDCRGQTVTLSQDITVAVPSEVTATASASTTSGVAALGVTFAANGGLPAVPDLVHWACEDGSGTLVTDSSVSGNDGTLSGAAWGSGHDGGGLVFTGASGDQVLDADAGLFLNGLDAITVAVWVKANAVGTDRGFVNGQDPDSTDGSVAMRYDVAGNSGGGTNVIKVALTTTGGNVQVESASNVQSTRWQHVAMTWSSGTALTLYIDGVATTPTAASGVVSGTVTGITKLLLGRGGKDAGSSWNGSLDDLRIYSRALTGNEVATLAGASSGSLTYTWDFDVSNGIQVDATGQNVYHVFDQPGVYTVTLTVTDGIDSATDTVVITVLSNRAVTITAGVAGVQWSSSPVAPDENIVGDSTTFSGLDASADVTLSAVTAPAADG